MGYKSMSMMFYTELRLSISKKKSGKLCQNKIKIEKCKHLGGHWWLINL